MTAFLLVLAVGVVAINTPAGHSAVGYPDAPPAPSTASAPERFALSPEERVKAVATTAKAECKGAGDRAQRLAKAHPDWKPAGVALVACHEYSVGMTSDMLRASLGSPERVNTTQTAGSAHEQWVYGNDFIYVDDGVVTSYQTSR